MRFRQVWNSLSPNRQGILCLLAASVFLSISWVLIKSLKGVLPVAEVAFFRNAVIVLLALPLLLRHGLRDFSAQRFELHLGRGIFRGLSMLCGFYAVAHLSLADATTLIFSQPLFMIPLALVFLGEKITWQKWLASVLGFAGVVVLVQPGQAAFQMAALAAVLGAILSVIPEILLKKMPREERHLTILFYSELVAMVLLAAPTAYYWQSPTLAQYAVLLAIGVLGAFALYLVILGYRRGEASVITPAYYTQIIFSGLMGVAFFDDVITQATILGVILIVGSTIYISRERSIPPAKVI